jgi:hypothetical protein
MEPKTILSLFDFTGEWTRPFSEAGHNVVQFDVKLEPSLMDVRRLSVEFFQEEFGLEWVDAIVAAPPCTDFTNSGAQYWRQKDRDGRTRASVELVRQVLRCVEYWKPDWWVIENPVGRLPRLVPAIGKARLQFDPCDFSGWAPDMTAADWVRLEELRALSLEEREQLGAQAVELVKRANAYTKRTQLWGHFNVPELRRVEPIKLCAQGSWLQKLGGKSEKTKAARSVTPAGFSSAFFAANDWSQAAISGWGGTSLERVEAEEAAA